MGPEVDRLERLGVCRCGKFVGADKRVGYAAPPENVACPSCLADRSSEAGQAGASRSADVLLPADWTDGAEAIAATLSALRGEPLRMTATNGEQCEIPYAPPPDETPPAPTVKDAPSAQAPRPRHKAEAVEGQGMPVQTRRRAGLFARLLTVRSFRVNYGQTKAAGDPDAAVRALLDAAVGRGVLSLHDRRIPGRRGHVEHIAVGASGIYVVDVKHFKNAVIEVRPADDPAAGAEDLVVGGRVMTEALVATRARVTALRSLLAAAGLDGVPVIGAACFVDGLPLRAPDVEVAGIHVVRLSGLTALVATAGGLTAENRQTLQQFLADELPPSA